jgi:hypothetical protein
MGVVERLAPAVQRIGHDALRDFRHDRPATSPSASSKQERPSAAGSRFADA